MSSLRNAVARRPHKERSQPTSRAKWGLLEKHKDYSLRAADFNQKKKKLNILTQKTKEKNPDEFSFGMLSSKNGRQGKHGSRGDENRLSHEAVQLLKTQDSGYLRSVMQRTRREVERVGKEVGMDGVLRGRREGSANGRKVVFGEDGEPVRKRARVSGASMDLENEDGDIAPLQSTIKVSETRPADLAITTKSAPKVLSRKQAEKEKDRLAQLKADRKRRKRLAELRTNKLEVLKKRQKEILAAAEQLELQRAKMGGTIGGTNKHGVKFKVRERKR
ncbi:hypothetical protein PMZ80_009439 [Knufia obscura]|uniref:U3 small nucleolar RNA-associated protein 11 n=1 Tax=Knufia obscura TaxID=1635080 RepID=A0ABR0RE53_9EURO|nr:hypothetical protein PMZ80_009439 [Knufia obscura]